MDIVQSINLITINPAIRGGSPCIAGTGLRVTDLVMAHLFHRRTPDEMAADYGISLAQVYASLAYYYENKAELDSDIREQIARSRNAKEQMNRAISEAESAFGDGSVFIEKFVTSPRHIEIQVLKLYYSINLMINKLYLLYTHYILYN